MKADKAIKKRINKMYNLKIELGGNDYDANDENKQLDSYSV